MQQGFWGEGGGAGTPPPPIVGQSKAQKNEVSHPYSGLKWLCLQECLLVTSGIAIAKKFRNQLFDKNCALMFTYNS